MITQEVSLDDMQWMQKKREADAAFIEAWENADFWRASDELLGSLNMSKFNKENAEWAKIRVANLEAQDWETEINWWDAFSPENDWITEWGKMPTEVKLDDTPENESKEEENVILWEWVYSPEIDKLISQWKITINKDQATTIKNTLLRKNIEDINNIPDTEVSSDIKTIVLEHLTDIEKPENQRQYSENFVESFREELQEFQNTKGEFNTENDQTAFDIISSRFVTPLEWEITPEERNLALHTAFATALNIEIDGKQFDRTNETYKQIVKDIINTELWFQDRFIAFKNLLNFSSVEQWKWWKQQEKRYAKYKAERLLDNAGMLERFEQLLAMFKAQEANSPRSIKIAQELDSIRQEAEISSWDAKLLAWWGKMELASESIWENWNKSA